MPVALFHGFLGAPSLWEPVLATLGDATAGPIALATLPGHGPAPWTVEGGFVAAVDALAAALPAQPRPWLLVGYSMGARVALALALRHPARACGAVLIGGDPGLETDAERAARRAWDEAQAEAIVALGVPAFVERWEALPLFATQSAEARAAQRASRLAHTAPGLAWAMVALGLGRMPALWSALANARVPLRVITGERDQKFTAIGARMAQLAPSCTHTVAPGAGHNVALEAPALVGAEIRAATAQLVETARAHPQETPS